MYRSGDYRPPGELTARPWWATALVVACIIGALNWGLVGFFNWNLVDAIFGPGFSRFIYAVVGLAGVALIFALPRLSRGRVKSRAGPGLPREP